MLRRPYYLWLLADVHRATGRPAAAIAALGEALAVAESNDEHWWTAEIHRARGELLEPAPEAGHRLRLAYEIAAGQASHQLALRAAISMVRRDPGQGDVLATAMAAMPIMSGPDRADVEELVGQGRLPV
jgi:predicted ATPase